MSSRYSTGTGRFKFEEGDVVQFNTLYKWCEEAKLDKDFTVVSDKDHVAENGSDVNSINNTISLKCVNAYWQDFMLMSRNEAVKPVTVNVTVNSNETDTHSGIDKPLGDRIQKVVSEAVSRISDKETILPVKINDKGVITGFGADGEKRWEFGLGGQFTVDADEIPVAVGVTGGKVKSTGGSSSYYDIPLPDDLMNVLFDRWEKGNAHIRTEELIRYAFSNCFDYGTAFKSMVRGHAITHLNSGKAGNDIGYECNKIDWSVNKIRQRFGNES